MPRDVSLSDSKCLNGGQKSVKNTKKLDFAGGGAGAAGRSNAGQGLLLQGLPHRRLSQGTGAGRAVRILRQYIHFFFFFQKIIFWKSMRREKIYSRQNFLYLFSFYFFFHSNFSF